MQQKEILEELKSIGTGKTLDAILPPLLFVLINRSFGLQAAIITAPALALLLGLIRLYRKQAWQYALGGLLGVALASGLAYLTRSAVGYFLPAIGGSVLLLFCALLSLLVGKPLAAWASHLSRGWPLPWYWRQDVKPAYREVTLIWFGFFLLRLGIQIILFRSGDPARLAWANIMLGWPVTIGVLVLSYIYGTRRLRRLGGPGVAEFITARKPPWQGQTRGF